jgi:UDP-2-acetamido-2,6-beta-L-arabino-hexul-4-ose reductase
LTSLRNVHVTTVKPGKVRGNHLHRKTTEVLVVKSTSNFEFHWQDNGADAGVRELGGASVTLIEVPPGTAHAVLNAGTSDLIVVALSDVAYDPDQPDVERQVLVRGVSDD